mgnify:CR=1 FL=1
MVYDNYEDFLYKNQGANIYMATTKARKIYTEVVYEPDSYIMFGKESAGIPEEKFCQYFQYLQESLVHVIQYST